MARGWRQGFYTLRNPEKYKGDPNNIVYRSSWELKMNQFLDGNPNVLEWGSEIIAIPYLKSLTGKIHKYFPDYYVKFKDKQGTIRTEIWEVKPDGQTKPPKRQGKRKKQQIYEQATYITNIDKWKQATKWCNKRGIKFRIITEKEMFR